jgi:hypothetical protein
MLSSDAARRHHRSTLHQKSTIVTAIQNNSDVHLPVNAGIKSLRATLPGDIYYRGFCFLNQHFVNICVKNQQINQLFIQFINYVWYILHVSALHCHPQGAFLVPYN